MNAANLDASRMGKCNSQAAGDESFDVVRRKKVRHHDLPGEEAVRLRGARLADGCIAMLEASGKPAFWATAIGFDFQNYS